MALLTAADTEAQIAIRDLTARTSDAVNRRNGADLAALFVLEGRWLVPGLDVSVGRTAIAAQLDHLLSGFDVMVQLLHGGQVDAGPDEDHATARWYITEQARDTAGTGWDFTGVYDDELVRTEDGWRFESRQFRFLYRGKTDRAGRGYPHPATENASLGS